jgi:hypothetical protein
MYQSFAMKYFFSAGFADNTKGVNWPKSEPTRASGSIGNDKSGVLMGGTGLNKDTKGERDLMPSV